jgi:hypothetical protein
VWKTCLCLSLKTAADRRQTPKGRSRVVGCFENGAPPKMKIEKKTFSDMISQAGENVVLVKDEHSWK